MKPLTNDEFAKAVMEMASPQKPFLPRANYDPDGDCIEFIIRPDNFYAHRIDELLTVYYSEDTHELVGSFIKSVKVFCRQLVEKSPWFGIIIEKPPIRLSHLFVARLSQLPGKPDTEELRVLGAVYQQLIQCAEREEIEIPPEACTA